MLPFIPEPIELMKKRFPKCLEKIWTVTYPMNDRPGLHRKHIFDFYNGLRLLISKDNIYGLRIHISASWENNTPNTISKATNDVITNYKLLGGIGEPKWLGISEMGIPHWIIDVQE